MVEVPPATDARLEQLCCAGVITAGHAFIQNIHRGELGARKQ
jgi:hypothetical protein